MIFYLLLLYTLLHKKRIKKKITHIVDGIYIFIIDIKMDLIVTNSLNYPVTSHN